MENADVCWLRLQRAVQTLSDGSTLTEAAHLAVFAESPQLMRTFAATLGVPPVPPHGDRIECADDTKPPLTLDGLALVDLV